MTDKERKSISKLLWKFKTWLLILCFPFALFAWKGKAQYIVYCLESLRVRIPNSPLITTLNLFYIQWSA
jgi:hypothetical protein